MIRVSMQQGHWVFRLDLKDAYFQIPFHPRSRKYLRMECHGKIYQFRTLPFGISMAPWLFTRVVSTGRSLFHQTGMTLDQYLRPLAGRWPVQLRRPQEVQSSCHTLSSPQLTHKPWGNFNTEVWLRRPELQPGIRNGIHYPEEPGGSSFHGSDSKASPSISSQKMTAPDRDNSNTSCSHSPRQIAGLALPIAPPKHWN